jgi:hypothetical protein
MSATIGDPAGPRAAHFEVILDSPMNLAVGGDIDHSFDFDLPNHVWERAPAIVSFLLVYANGLRLQVTWNDKSVVHDYSAGPERLIHEVMGEAARGGANQLTLLVQRGSLRISDLVLWYQVR